MFKFVEQVDIKYTADLLRECHRVNELMTKPDSSYPEIKLTVRHIDDGLFFQDWSGDRTVQVRAYGACTVELKFIYKGGSSDGTSTTRSATNAYGKHAKMILDFFLH